VSVFASPPRSTRSASGTYLRLVVVAATASSLAFTATNLYRLRVAGLNPFELVMVGTAMEAAVLLFEIPTGVVADLYSRKWSVVTGHLGMGIGLIVEPIRPGFIGSLTGQVLWGIAYTFTSGATLAWLTTEMGDPGARELNRLFLRTGRWTSVAGLFGLLASFVLMGWNVRAPIMIGGLIEVGLGLWLASAMHETAFASVRQRGNDDVGGGGDGGGERSQPYRHLMATARSGLRYIRHDRTLFVFAVAIALAGGASEAYDRLRETHLVGSVGLPHSMQGSPVYWLGVIGVASALLGIAFPWWLDRRAILDTPRRIRNGVLLSATVRVIGLALFALTRSFVVAAIAAVVLQEARSLYERLQSAWLIPLTPKNTRATVLSTLEQADSFAQVGVGPLWGVLGSAVSVPASVALSAAMIAPTVPLLATVPPPSELRRRPAE
jgi:MFS transporter, DHA3 family, tetracycline resistance protein